VVHVPFLLKKANADHRPNVVYEGISRSIDVGTTLLAAAGIDAKLGDGVDLGADWDSLDQRIPFAYSETGLWLRTILFFESLTKSAVACSAVCVRFD